MRMARGVWLAALLAAAAEGQDEAISRLGDVRRIHVETLSGGETAEQIRDLLISRLQRTGLFLLTENPERADAFLRGSAEDLVYTETHETREGVDARTAIGIGRSSTSTSRNTGGLSLSGGAGENESSRSTERRHEASAAVRLVDRNGDVIWAANQESRGAKFAGASADVAEKIARQLAADYRRARGQPPGGAPPSANNANPLPR